jgi:pantoate--beta-alanine ligase
MKILKTTQELIDYRNSIPGSVGLVPTMGALHQGHISLIKNSIQNNDATIVSVFVNPTQFLEGEDFQTYPNRQEADIKICQIAGVDALFMPTPETMYYECEPHILAPDLKAYILEGAKRPKHFDGVLRVVLKLFNLTHPNNAYFGKKDAQQLYLIQNMVKTLFLPITINPCEIVREENGLALSSRNAYLNEEEKQKALSISASLKTASKEIIQGDLNVNQIKSKMLEEMNEIEVEYIAVVNREFELIETIEIKNSIILIAAKVGSTRLIDNMWI